MPSSSSTHTQKFTDSVSMESDELGRLELGGGRWRYFIMIKPPFIGIPCRISWLLFVKTLCKVGTSSPAQQRRQRETERAAVGERTRVNKEISDRLTVVMFLSTKTTLQEGAALPNIESILLKGTLRTVHCSQPSALCECVCVWVLVACLWSTQWPDL